MGQKSTIYSSVTPEEKKLIKYSWTFVNHSLGKFGEALFIVLFTDFPSVLNYFPFRGPSDEAFENHCKIFMQELDKMVKNIEKPDFLLNLFQINAKIHAERNILSHDYDTFRKCTLKMFAQQLGSNRFPVETAEAWDKVLRMAFSFMLDINSDDTVINQN